MPSQQHIERFTLAFHVVALNRLRSDSQNIVRAIAVIDRWQAQGASIRSKPYRDQWRLLLGFLLTPDERLEVRTKVMDNAV